MTVTIRHGDCREVLRTMPDESVHCVVTSPPYWGLRDYGVAGQIGLEISPDQFVGEMVAVFAEVRRVLRADGTLWLNLGDSYAAQRGGTQMPAETLAGGDGGFGDKNSFRGRLQDAKQYHRDARAIGLKHKDLVGIPWRVAFALQADGWYLRQDIIWSKPNPMPESVTDRCTKAHEYIFLMSKSARYWFDAKSISEPCDPKNGRDTSTARRVAPPGSVVDSGFVNGRRFETRNKRSVWDISTQPFSEAHFATFPPELIEPCVKAGCPVGGLVLDPFGGAGTTGMVADRLRRDAILIELNPEYAAIADRRIRGDAGMFADVVTVSDTSGIRESK